MGSNPDCPDCETEMKHVKDGNKQGLEYEQYRCPNCGFKERFWEDEEIGYEREPKDER